MEDCGVSPVFAVWRWVWKGLKRMPVRNMLGRTKSDLCCTNRPECTSVSVLTCPLYDGVLTQWQFPWVWLANRNPVERALFRFQFPPKRLFRNFEPSIDIDYCARSRKRAVFFLREVQLVLVVLKLLTSSSRPTGELERQLRKVCCCHVTWDECAIKVCLGSKTRWRTTLSKPTGHRFHHNASTKASKDCCNRLQVCRWVKHTRSCTANVG